MGLPCTGKPRGDSLSFICHNIYGSRKRQKAILQKCPAKIEEEAKSDVYQNPRADRIFGCFANEVLEGYAYLACQGAISHTTKGQAQHNMK